jgi:hypothetical protein
MMLERKLAVRALDFARGGAGLESKDFIIVRLHVVSLRRMYLFDY